MHAYIRASKHTHIATCMLFCISEGGLQLRIKVDAYLITYIFAYILACMHTLYVLIYTYLVSTQNCVIMYFVAAWFT